MSKKKVWSRLTHLFTILVLLVSIFAPLTQFRGEKVNAAGAITIKNVTLKVSGQTLNQTTPTMNLSNTAKMFPESTNIRATLAGDGVSTIYDIPITISNTGPDSTGAFGPLQEPGIVYDTATGKRIGTIQQTGKWDDVLHSYTGKFQLVLDAPITGEVAFDVTVAGSGEVESNSSQNPMIITFDNTFKYTVNPSPRNLSLGLEPSGNNWIRGFNSGVYGIDGNEGYVYFGQNNTNPFLYDDLLMKSTYDSATQSGMRKKYLDEDEVYGLEFRGAMPKGPFIYVQKYKSETPNVNIAGVEVENQGTHSLRISDGTTDGTPTIPGRNNILDAGVNSATYPYKVSPYMLADQFTLDNFTGNTGSKSPDIDKGIQYDIAPTKIDVGTLPDTDTEKVMADRLIANSKAQGLDVVEGNAYAVSKVGDYYYVAFNYGDIWKRKNITTQTYFGDKIGTFSDSIQEVNRTTTLNNTIDKYLGTQSPVKGATTDGTGLVPSLDYKGQVLDNYVNTKIIFDKPVLATASAALKTFVYTSDGIQDQTGIYANGDSTNNNLAAKTATATNYPSNGLLEGQTIVNIFYVDKQGNQLKDNEHYVGWPDTSIIGTPSGPFNVTPPETLPSADGTQTLKLYKNRDVDGTLDQEYVSIADGGGHILGNPPTADVYKYPTGPMGTTYNYYYVYDNTTTFSSVKLHKRDSTTHVGLAGAKFVLTTVPNDDLRNLAVKYNAAATDEEREDILTQMQSHVAVLDFKDSPFGGLTDDYSRVWRLISGDPSMDIDGDDKVTDTDKELWIKDQIPDGKNPKYLANTYVATSDKNGDIQVDNLQVNDDGTPKKYYAIEIEAPSGYELPDYNTNLFEVTTGDPTSYTPVEIDNKKAENPNGKITITKSSEALNGNPTQLLPGAQFVLSSYKAGADKLAELSTKLQELYATGKTDSSPEVTAILTEMRHYGVLNSVDTDYTKNTDNYSGIWNVITKQNTATAYDLNKDGKVDDTDKGLWLDGSGVTGIYNPEILVGTTNVNGQVVFPELELNADGSKKQYWAVEIKAPTGYVVSTPIKVDAEGSPTVNSSAQLDVTNPEGDLNVTDLSTHVVIDKTSAENQEKLPGAKFALFAANNNNGVWEIKKDASGNPIEITNDANGIKLPELTTTGSDGKYASITLNNLPIGEYMLVETQAPTGHELIKEPRHFTVQNSSTTVNWVVSDLPQTELPYTGGKMRQITWIILLVSSLAALIAIAAFTRSFRQARGGFV